MIRVGVALAVVGWVLHQSGATTVGGWSMVLAPLIVWGGLRARRVARYRSVRVHTHGGHGTRTAAEHEDGHLRVAKGFRRDGVRTGAATINPDGSGVTQVWIPRDADPNIDIAISAGGRIASRSGAGCGGSFWPDRGSDNWFIERAVRRGGSRAAGEAMARQQLARSRSRASELYRNGVIR